MEDSTDITVVTPQSILVGAIEDNNEDLFLRHVGFKRKDRLYPIDISTAVLHCCQHGRVEMLKTLLTFHLNINFQDGDNRRALHYAAINGQIEIVKMVMSQGTTVNCYDKMSYCPIHYACENGFADVVQYLIRRGAHVTFSKIFTTGESPLHVACRAGHVDVVKVLLDNGADIHCKLDQSKNCQYAPLHVAAKWQKWEVIETLCNHGVLINMQSSKGHTALHISAQLGNVMCVKTLLEFGADVSIVDKNGNSAMLFAICEGWVEIVKILLTYEADVCLHNGVHITALRQSLSGPEHGCFEALVEAGGDILEQKEDTQESLVMLAAGLADIPKVELLLQKGADVNLGDFRLYTPLHRCQALKESDSVKLELSKLLIKCGAKINATDKDGFTPLHRAIFTNVIRSNQSRPCLQLLVQCGSRLWPGPVYQEGKGQSPLCWLAWNRQYEVADYLVQAGWEMVSEYWIYITPREPKQIKLHVLLQQTNANSKSLKHYCRQEIRKTLSHATNDLEILTSIGKLPVPSTMKDYLGLKDCQFKEPEFFQ